MALLCVLSLKKALSSFDELLKHETSKITNNNEEGLRILGLHLLDHLNIVFELDLLHYTATLFHLRYRQLKGCSNAEREQVSTYVWKEMKRIISQSKQHQQDVLLPETKKHKVYHSILEEYGDDDDINLATTEDNTSGNENFAYKSLPPDKLT
ncbi:unnamed protein product, partial [Rotaria sordida]